MRTPSASYLHRYTFSVYTAVYRFVLPERDAGRTFVP